MPRSMKRNERTIDIENSLEAVNEELLPLYEEWQRREDDKGFIFSKTTWNKIKSPVLIILYFIGLAVWIFFAGASFGESIFNAVLVFGILMLLGFFSLILSKKFGVLGGLLMFWGIVFLLLFVYFFYFK